MSENQRNLPNLTRGWTTPPELAGSPPRPVRYTALGILSMVAALGIVAAAALLAYYQYGFGAQQTERGDLLREQGADTAGTVTRLWRGGSKNRQHMIAYEFRVGDSVMHGQTSVPRSFWESVSEGKQIPIRYLPFNPIVNRPAGAADADPSMFTVVIAPLLLLGVAGIFVYRLRTQRRLAEDGSPAPGVITSSRRARHGRRFIRYEFLLPGAKTESGSGMARRSSVDAEGTVITVLYDPDDPRRVRPYPFDLVKVVR